MDDFPSIDLSVLTARQREVIEMHYSSCLSFAGIAMFLGVSKSTVQVHHNRALGKLRASCDVIRKPHISRTHDTTQA